MENNDKILASIVNVIIADGVKKGYFEIDLNNKSTIESIIRYYSTSLADIYGLKIHYCGSFIKRIYFILSHWKVRKRYQKVNKIDRDYIIKHLKEIEKMFNISEKDFEQLKNITNI